MRLSHYDFISLSLLLILISLHIFTGCQSLDFSSLPLAVVALRYYFLYAAAASAFRAPFLGSCPAWASLSVAFDKDGQPLFSFWRRAPWCFSAHDILFFMLFIEHAQLLQYQGNRAMLNAATHISNYFHHISAISHIFLIAWYHDGWRVSIFTLYALFLNIFLIVSLDISPPIDWRMRYSTTLLHSAWFRHAMAFYRHSAIICFPLSGAFRLTTSWFSLHRVVIYYFRWRWYIPARRVASRLMDILFLTLHITELYLLRYIHVISQFLHASRHASLIHMVIISAPAISHNELGERDADGVARHGLPYTCLQGSGIFHSPYDIISLLFTCIADFILYFYFRPECLRVYHFQMRIRQRFGISRACRSAHFQSLQNKLENISFRRFSAH